MFCVMYGPKYPMCSSLSGFPPVSGFIRLFPHSHLSICPGAAAASERSGIAESQAAVGWQFLPVHSAWLAAPTRLQFTFPAAPAGQCKDTKLQAASPAQLHLWKWLSVIPSHGGEQAGTAQHCRKTQ